MLKTILVTIASLMSVIAYIPYIADILKNKTKPHLYSWFVWTILTVIGFFGQLAGGAGTGSALLGTTAVICLIIFILSLKKGTKDIQTIDLFSIIGAISAMVLWLITKTPFLSVILITLTDALALFPTVRKSFSHPFTETIISYEINIVKQTLGLFALQKYSIITALYPVYMILANVFVVTFLAIRRKQLKR